MSKVRVGIKDRPIPVKIAMLRQRVKDLTDNPSFPTPTPPLSQLLETADALETAYHAALDARETAKVKTVIQDKTSAAADAIYTRLSQYVDAASAGDAAKIMSAGFSLRSGNTPLGTLPCPAQLQAKPGNHTGTIDLSWQKIRGARAYTVERATDAGGELIWQSAANVTKPKASVNTMTPGKKYWFRVASVGAAGQGPWSDLVGRVVA